MARPSQRPHAEQVRAVLEDGTAARSTIAASWRRCMTLYRLDPERAVPPPILPEAAMRERRERLGALVAAAQPVMERLLQATGGMGCCVLLTDRDGVPVERRGHGSDDRQFRDWGLWTGALWNEAHAGTNGIGTCLAERRALTVHRDQHFHTFHAGLSCTTVPVFDHAGELAGALDVSSCRADLTEQVSGLIAAATAEAARRIEERNFRHAFPRARIVLADETAPSGAAPGALLAIDADDLVVGATRAARLALGITAERLRRPLPAADLLDGGRDGAPEDDLGRAERAALQRALARAGGNVSATASALGLSRATLHRKLRRLGLRGRE
ncbi:GAF domain-containing protein [Roseomonas sp. NAR14]|uniref:GAF domain-containing protein n=1 Tax=Roseomonas acroporae TaxID=2937791 RepID=A0A9X1YB15_9PROT|nr:GAF domain-containing protein [Roseomonas acroporae]MCK8786143.1 GAF domain-containing protein [Roseomonas acroporae]